MSKETDKVVDLWVICYEHALQLSDFLQSHPDQDASAEHRRLIDEFSSAYLEMAEARREYKGSIFVPYNQLGDDWINKATPVISSMNCHVREQDKKLAKAKRAAKFSDLKSDRKRPAPPLT